MTAEQAERKIENKTNAADASLMAGRMTQAEYDRHMRAINRWAEQLLSKAG
jgi:hypothetical protein